MARRPLLALLAAGMVALAAPASVSAESALWTLVASPLAATTGVQTTFTLTATNTDPAALLLSDSEIGCIFVDVPSDFTVQDAAVSGSNAGSGWHKDAITGNRVKIHTDSGGERLELLDWVRFTITATAWSTGSLTWSSRAYRDQDCGGSGALLSVPPIVVVAGPTVTPTPVPTPIPTPKPTVRPTPTPAPTIPLPIPLPSFPLPSMPLPSIGLPSIGPTGSPAPTPRSTSPTLRPAATGTVSPSDPPSPSGSPAPSSGTGLPGVSPPSIGGGVDSPTGVAGPAVSHDAPRLDFDAAELDIDFESTGLLNGTTVWLVPTATFAIPAVLLLLFVALQAVGALAWVPAVRRLGGRDDEVA